MRGIRLHYTVLEVCVLCSVQAGGSITCSTIPDVVDAAALLRPA
jgi:hypothetical protein